MLCSAERERVNKKKNRHRSLRLFDRFWIVWYGLVVVVVVIALFYLYKFLGKMYVYSVLTQNDDVPIGDLCQYIQTTRNFHYIVFRHNSSHICLVETKNGMAKHVYIVLKIL